MAKNSKKIKGIKNNINTMGVNNEPMVRVIKEKQVSKSISNALGDKNNKDIHIKQTQRWEDLNSIYNDLAKGMVDLAQQVAQVVNTIKESGNEVTGELAIVVKALYVDLDNMSKDLTDILKHHEGKTGLVKNDDELAQLLETFNMYYLLFDRFKALTFQELLIITEHAMSIKKANEENIEEKKEEDIKNNIEDAVIVSEVKKD